MIESGLSVKKNLLFWLGIHLLLTLLFFFRGGITVGTDLYGILPSTNEQDKLNQIEKELTQRISRNISILVGSLDEKTARKEAILYADYLEELDNLTDVQVLMDQGSIQVIQDFLHDYRYHYLSSDAKNSLVRGDISYLQQNSYFILSSPLVMGNLDRLDEDPFLLAPNRFQEFIASPLMNNTAMTLNNSVRYREYEGKHWVLITAKTALSGSTVELEKNPIPHILKRSEHRMLTDESLEFVFSGVPFHSYLSARQSKNEITLLSTLSTLFILILILVVFRSFLPLIATICTIALGIISGLMTTSLIFHEVNIFTIVFGTSLIGITVDYSFHYFSYRADSERSGTSIQQHVMPGITMGLLTTSVSYGAFFFCPFPLLQQMALFSISGLVSSYITVSLIYPLLRRGGAKGQKITLKFAVWVKSLFNRFSVLPNKIVVLILCLVIVYLVLGLRQCSLENVISDYYQMSPQMKLWEEKSRKILNHRSEGISLFIEGNNLQECLEESELLQQELEVLVGNDALGSFLGLHQLLPSHTEQRRQYNLLAREMLPHIQTQLQLLGYQEDKQDEWYLDFMEKREQFVELDNLQMLPIKALLDSLYLGQSQDKVYTNILLFDVEDINQIKTMVNQRNGVYLNNKIDDVNSVLKKLSRQSLIIIAISYVVIFLLLLIRYPLQRAMMIVLIPLTAGLVALSTVILMGNPVNLFVIVALILIPGMGSDYIILLSENKEQNPLVYLSITMSMLTTLLAFGLLGMTTLSGSIGMTVAIGLLSSYLLTLLLMSGRKRGRIVS